MPPRTTGPTLEGLKDLTFRPARDGSKSGEGPSTAEELAAIGALSRAMTRNLSVRHVVAVAHEQLAATVFPDLTIIYLRSGDRLILQEDRSPKRGIAHRSPATKAVGKCLCGIVAATGKPAYSLDIHSDRRCTLTECKNAGIRSFAALPLAIGETVLGVLGLASLKTRDFSERSSLLETISVQIALCLHNAALYEELHKRAADLEHHLKLRQRAEEKLKTQTTHLMEVNAALKVLLGQRDRDRTEMEEQIVANVRALMLPPIARLKAGRLSALQKSAIETLEASLGAVVSPFVKRLGAGLQPLTPKEIQVADLIRQGRSTKEIAQILDASTRAIAFHRDNLRKKLGLRSTKANLRTHLLSLA